MSWPVKGLGSVNDLTLRRSEVVVVLSAQGTGVKYVLMFLSLWPFCVIRVFILLEILMCNQDISRGILRNLRLVFCIYQLTDFLLVSTSFDFFEKVINSVFE